MSLAVLTTLALAGASGWAASGLIAAAIRDKQTPAGFFHTVPGGRLHYADSAPDSAPGDRTRPVVVLLHGASSHHADLFSVLTPRLGRHARVIAPDRPGHGHSERLGGREMADPVRQAEAIAALLDGLGVSRCILCAHSLAGAMATRLALTRPDLVAGLVLVAAVTHPWPGGKITWYYHPASWPVIGPVFIRTLAAPAGMLAMEPSIAGVFAPQPVPDGYAKGAGIALVLRPEAFAANAQDVAGILAFVTRQCGRYGELAMPVTAIAGEADSVVWTDVHSRAIAREARNGRLITLPGVGHMPHHTTPDLVAAEILRLL
jgi:pimeloyl-ACP methyl ester carboxylesterase